MSHITDPNCIFCKIVAGEIPSYKVYEDDNFFGFLTIKPHTKGHMLLIPKTHTQDILSADEFTSIEIFSLGKKLAQKIKNILGTPRVGFLLAGLEVNHLHLHLIPLTQTEQLNPHSAYDLPKEEAQEVVKMYKF
jgi:histidine triad (HIT) family protein